MFEEKKCGKLNYIIRYPDGYTPDNAYPTIIFMHGAGTRGTDINLLKGNPFFPCIAELDSFPFIVAAPLCHKDTWFDLFESVIDFTEEIYNRKDVDKSSFYVLGASMGGYATWQLAMSRPDLFAAIIPICGGGMYWNGDRLINIPVWAFHGDIDPIVSVEESKRLVATINRKGGNAKLTVYENCGHDAWSATYKNQQVFDWLLTNRSKNSEIKSAEFSDSKIYG